MRKDGSKEDGTTCEVSTEIDPFVYSIPLGNLSTSYRFQEGLVEETATHSTQHLMGSFEDPEAQRLIPGRETFIRQKIFRFSKKKEAALSDVDWEPFLISRQISRMIHPFVLG